MIKAEIFWNDEKLRLDIKGVVLEPAGAVLGSTSAILAPKNAFMVSENAVLERPGAARHTAALAHAPWNPQAFFGPPKALLYGPEPHFQIPWSSCNMNYCIKPTIFIKNDTCNRRCARSKIFGFGTTAIAGTQKRCSGTHNVLEPAGAVLVSTSAVLELKNALMVSESAVLERPGAARRTPGFADATLEPTSVVLTSKKRCFTAQNHTSKFRGLRAIYELQYETNFFI